MPVLGGRRPQHRPLLASLSQAGMGGPHLPAQGDGGPAPVPAEDPPVWRNTPPWNEPVIGIGEPTNLLRRLDIDRRSPRTEICPWSEGGGAESTVRGFVAHRLDLYPETATIRCSTASPGCRLPPLWAAGALRVALAVQSRMRPMEAKAAFREELIVRRELADNFCYYCRDHDRYEGFPNGPGRRWRSMPRTSGQHSYSLEELEAGETEDGLWNAMQTEMVRRGKDAWLSPHVLGKEGPGMVEKLPEAAHRASDPPQRPLRAGRPGS